MLNYTGWVFMVWLHCKGFMPAVMSSADPDELVIEWVKGRCRLSIWLERGCGAYVWSWGDDFDLDMADGIALDVRYLMGVVQAFFTNPVGRLQAAADQTSTGEK